MYSLLLGWILLAAAMDGPITKPWQTDFKAMTEQLKAMTEVFQSHDGPISKPLQAYFKAMSDWFESLDILI